MRKSVTVNVNISIIVLKKLSCIFIMMIVVNIFEKTGNMYMKPLDLVDSSDGLLKVASHLLDKTFPFLPESLRCNDDVNVKNEKQKRLLRM